MPEDQQQEAGDPRDAAIKAAVAFLKTKGVDRITIEYSGYGDSGCIEDIQFIEQPRKIDAPGQVHPERIALSDHRLPGVSAESLRWHEHDPPTVGDVLEDYAYQLLADRHGGWEINEGSRGDMCVNLKEGTVRHTHGEHYQHTEWHEHESTL